MKCYLLREDGEWFNLGSNHEWRLAFGAFNGSPNGSLVLSTEDAPLLALRLECSVASAQNIIRWADDKWVRFMSELEIEPDGVTPTPITGWL